MSGILDILLGLRSLSHKHMFRALGAFFQVIFLVILFKMFAPQLAELLVRIITNILLIVDSVVNNMASQAPSAF